MCQCSTNNCGCNDYTLPAGLTGPTGATGATGATGPAGANIIDVIDVNTSTSGTSSFETIYTYTIPSTVSFLDGDILEIYAYWSTTPGSTAIRPVRIQMDGTTLLGLNPSLGGSPIGGSIVYVNHHYSLVRVNSTAMSVAVQATVCNGWGLTAGAATIYHYPNANAASYQTVSNLDTGGNIITFQGTSTTAGDITLDKIVIAKITKL